MNETPPEVSAPQLLAVSAVGRLLSLSVRQVYRLSRSGRMPRSVRIGHSARCLMPTESRSWW